MKLIDDRGNLFGAVNIIDALVVLLVVAVVVAGAAFVATGGDEPTQPQEPSTTTATATVEVAGVQPYVADALTVGPVDTGGIVAIENKSVSPTIVVTEDESGNLYEREHPQQRTVRLELTLETLDQDGERQFQGEPLEIGRTATLDFGDVTVDATFTALNDSE